MNPLAMTNLRFNSFTDALQVMTQVAITVEQSLSDGDNAKRLCEIQRKVFGQYEIIAPGRQLLKEGELLKFSRKEQQPRLLFLVRTDFFAELRFTEHRQHFFCLVF